MSVAGNALASLKALRAEWRMISERWIDDINGGLDLVSDYDTAKAYGLRADELTPIIAVLEAEQPRNDYNEPIILVKQRVAIVERLMKLPYIKATRDTDRGEERFIARDDIVKAVHDYATAGRALASRDEGSDRG